MALLWRHLKAVQVFGANTDVGKTIFTTLLCQTAKQHWRDDNVTFVKPVSTGSDVEADEAHIQRFTSGVNYKTLVQYDIPVSPHLAAQVSNKPIISDKALIESCRQFATQCSAAGNGWLFVETAGGVHSPAPSSTTQADLYIPLRIPVILIGDSRLGGISQTISAFESLHLRGYDVQSVLLFQEDRYQNYQYLTEYFAEKFNVPVKSILPPPEKDSNEARDQQALRSYYQQHVEEQSVQPILVRADEQHKDHIKRLEEMSTKAYEKIWYPFTQHKLLSPERITTIDSAHGDCFQTVNKKNPNQILQASFDGSSSWWTQGLGHANPQLTLAAANAAGRYGHVMFAETIHQPAMALAELLLEGAKNPRFSRVFYSDNGSTGIEVALKMGLRAAKKRYGWTQQQKLGIIGLKGSYHGDTIGAMDAAEPCDYNESVEWYEGKGFWFNYPTVLCSNGSWGVQVPEDLESALGQGKEFASLDHIFDFEAREKRSEHVVYEKYITSELERLHQQGRRFGALILEPIVLGAGGMALVDPLFQRTLVNVVRNSSHLFDNGNSYTPSKDTEWTGLPVLFDEVFTGLYRLGRFTSASFLGVHPDVSVHAKLLTGGLVPLCTTLASENIFEAFSSDTKADALLHGHSYTAYPIGCQVGLASVTEMQKMEDKGEWNWAKQQGWRDDAVSSTASGHVWSNWPRDLVMDLSKNTERVAGAWALGSVLAVHLKDASGTGYSSNAAVSLREALGETVSDELEGPFNIHCRVLGNVIYFMTSIKTDEPGVQKLATLLRKALKC